MFFYLFVGAIVALDMCTSRWNLIPEIAYALGIDTRWVVFLRRMWIGVVYIRFNRNMPH